LLFGALKAKYFSWWCFFGICGCYLGSKGMFLVSLGLVSNFLQFIFILLVQIQEIYLKP
jgi:hypothetical protein